MKQGDGVTHGATAALRRNLKVSPNIDHLLSDVAHLSGQQRLEAIETAESAVLDALDRRPDDPDLMVARAWLLSVQDHEVKAAEWAEKALAVDTAHKAAWHGRIHFLRYARQFDAAGSALDEALVKWPNDPDLVVTGAWLFSAQDRENEAVEWAERALAVDPTHTWALRSRVDFLRYARQFETAEEALQASLAVWPDDPDLLVAGAWLFNAQDRENEAVEWAERALAVDPGHARALRSRVEFLRYAHRFEAAEDALHAALDRRPDDPDLLLPGAWLLSNQDRDDETLAWIQRALAIAPYDPEALHGKVLHLTYQCDFGPAEAALHEALTVWPEDPNLLAAGAWLFTAQNRHDEAVRWSERAVAAAPRQEWVHQNRVHCLRSAGRFEAAEAALQDALAVWPDHPDVLLAGAWLLSDQEREDEAVEWAERTLAVAPRHIWAHQGRVIFLRPVRRFTAAETAVQEALTLWPEDPSLLVAGAWAFSDQGRDDEAAEWIERALAVAPRHTGALQSRVYFLRNRRQFEAAESALRDALDRRPPDPHLLAAGAWVFSDQGRNDEAVIWIERALAIAPASEEALSCWVDFLRLDGRYDEARAAAYKALEIQPDSASTHGALGRLQDATFELEDALVSFSDALRLAPDGIELSIGRSATLRSLRRYDEAERAMTRLSRLRPWSREVKMETGWIHHDAKRLPEATRVFESLYSTAANATERSTALFGLGWVAFAGDDYQTAEERFRLAVSRRDSSENRLALAWSLARQSDPASWTEADTIAYDVSGRGANSASAHLCLGVLAFKRGNLASSEHHLRTALKIDPYSGSHTDLGALFAHLGRQQEAEELFRTAIQRDWYDIIAHIELGAVLLHSGDERLGDAEREFRRAISIDPTSATAAIGLAEAQDKSGDDAGAESGLRQAIRLSKLPERWRVELALARLLIRRGDKQQNADLYAEAYTYSQRAIGQAPDHTAEPHYLAGVAQYRIGSLFAEAGGRSGFRRAQRHLRACLRRDPNHSEAQRALAALERQIATARRSAWGGWALGGVSVGMLIAIWAAFLTSSKVTSVVVASTTPALIGLLVVSVLLPSLIRLKLPGFQADLRPRLAEFTAGPTGDTTFGPGRLPVTSGPTGQLPRRS